MEDSDESKRRKLAQNAYLEGRKKARIELLTRQLREKKIKLAELVIKVHDMKLDESERWNVIVIFKSRSGDAKSAWAQRSFSLKQEEVLKFVK